MSERISSHDERVILNTLDFINESDDYKREDYVWCRNTIRKLLLEIHYLNEELGNINT